MSNHTYKLLISFVVISTQLLNVMGQNPLNIPNALTGTNFNLTIQSGNSSFYPGTTTPTYGINGIWMAPTIIVNKGDSITLNVTNNLSTSTTIHWHGLHVAPQNDGGPHQLINPATTWSPSFKVLNNAGTFWYHPHGLNKTDLHVSKGIAGFFIIHDAAETTLNLPHTYGIDDFPIVVQSKSFDILQQIAIATEMDTAIFVNGTLHPYQNIPSQVVRLRLLNGSSMRAYNFGFTANLPFKLIATDAGLIDSAITLTRILLSPGERVEILLDLQGKNGDTIFLKNFSSEIPNGVYGAATVTGMGGATITGYDQNPLNGLDYNILQLNIVGQTTTPIPITTIPTTLVTNTPWDVSLINDTKNFRLAPESMGPTFMVQGPFRIDGVNFDMDSINRICYLNNIEKWRWTNNTSLAHPIHIHDMYFYILNINGGAVPNYEQGKKDVVLIMPGQYVEFITKFEDFADNDIPYMYHCHLLHHEDDGMMGSFIVRQYRQGLYNISTNSNYEIYPNPSTNIWTIRSYDNEEILSYQLYDTYGRIVREAQTNNIEIQVENKLLNNGLYSLKIFTKLNSYSFNLIKN